MWYSNLEKTFISRHNHHQHWYTCPIALPMHWNLQHRSLLAVFSATSAPLFQPLRHQWIIYHPVVNHLTWQTLLTINRKHFFMNILSIEFFCSQKRTIECCYSVVHTQAQSHFAYCNQPLNMHMHVCYIDCHGAGLCCYLVIHIGNLFIHYSCFTSICDLFTDFPL
jgi:hypothetical protein